MKYFAILDILPYQYFDYIVMRSYLIVVKDIYLLAFYIFIKNKNERKSHIFTCLHFMVKRINANQQFALDFSDNSIHNCKL